MVTVFGDRCDCFSWWVPSLVKATALGGGRGGVDARGIATEAVGIWAGATGARAGLGVMW